MRCRGAPNPLAGVVRGRPRSPGASEADPGTHLSEPGRSAENQVSRFLLLGNVMKPAVLLLLSVVATIAAAAPQATPVVSPPPPLPVQFADRDLTIDRPADWRDSGIRGGGVQVHLIGGVNGFPHFTIQSDAGAGLPFTVSPASERHLVEELFSTLIRSVSGTTVLNASWSGINGLRVHDSMSVRPSAAGPIKVRRLLFLHAGVPYVLSWGAPADEYETIAEQVARCASSLRYSD